MTNPLLQATALPAFARIRAEHVEPAIRHLLAAGHRQLEALLDTPQQATWDNTLQPLEELEDRLRRAWSPVEHLHAVADHAALRAAYNRCLPVLSDHATRLAQHQGLFAACRALTEHPSFATLDAARQKVVRNRLRDFRLAGVELPAAQRQRFGTLQQELTRLHARFEENLLDATNDWTLHVRAPQKLTGLPDSALDFASENARRAGLDGWLLTLDAPCYTAVMSHAQDASLRHTLYRAYHTRASELGRHPEHWDNSALMRDILRHRTEQARLVGFPSYAHYSLATRMARTPQEVLEFLRELADKNRPAARREYQELCEFARQQDGREHLAAWDIPYYSERLLQHRHAISQEALRPYFPLPHVLQGLFAVAQGLFGVRIEPRAGVETWHADVRFFEIRDETGALRGSFYLDPYVRKHKRGGAWMDECVVRRATPEGRQDPVAYLNCNFTPAADGRPALLTHDEVLTLFHEFGHGLQHMLTRMEHADVSGINGIPWDAVELPSQFMENLCWEREVMELCAKHIDTGAALGDALHKKLRAVRTFQSGLHMARQLELALFDFRLHLECAQDPDLSIPGLLNDVRRQVAVLPVPDFNRFQHGFSHIFAGGYAAGYYSYKWAEVLSADAFSKFEERGVLDRATGREFMAAFLEPGGSEEPLELFIRFRGRQPDSTALLRHSGILPAGPDEA